jgi:transposase
METIKLKSRKEIAEELGISTRTLKRWTKKFEIEIPSGLICPKIQKALKSRVFLDDSFEKSDFVR